LFRNILRTALIQSYFSQEIYPVLLALSEINLQSYFYRQHQLQKTQKQNLIKQPLTRFQPEQLSEEELLDEKLQTTSEIKRGTSITQKKTIVKQRKFSFLSNLKEVMKNVIQWNREMLNSEIQTIWGKRRITYFVFNPFTNEFAPSKFCAYSSIEKFSPIEIINGATMTISFYDQVKNESKTFNGNVARKYLENRLGMHLVILANIPSLSPIFYTWYQKHQDFINLPDEGLSILVPPDWHS
jgi:hypothetical protein